jgi:alkanesulfonate monooxygenase SsuD/methylene tetrahydromethanopterin reductase-like flavin-dependent oxidoreductase (luciferase family)
MKFGVFDHVDRSDRPLAKQLDERLEFVAAADAAGFYAYHVAEHHATPLNMVPVPGVYLGAVARATQRIRLGPLVYLLPLYSPLRLIEEVCILDHLSHGRLEVGIGRGVSPFELNYHNVDTETSREVFVEAFEALTNGLTHPRLDHSGKRFSYRNVPMELAPLQQPHPPIWYPSSNETGAGWAGARGLHFSTLGAVDRAKACIDAYKAAYARRGAPATPNGAFPGGTAIGVNRHIVVAETDAAARRLAEPAFEHWHANLTKLERENVAGPRYTGAILGDIDQAVAKGALLVGAPDTVRAAVERQIRELGINYMILGFFFGTLPFADAMRSLGLFAQEAMPRLAHL